MSSENSELVMSRLNYDIEKLKQFIYAAEQSEQEAVEIIAELKAENAKLKEENFKLGQIDVKKVTLVENRQLEEENKKLKEKLEKIEYIVNHCGINDRDCCFCKFDKECEGYYIEFILKIIRGEE